MPAIPFIPNRQVYVLTCIDPRVDPASILGLELGDAIVERNVGGRVTPAVIQDVAWISYLHEVKTPDADWFELAIIHHTDCGSGFFADPELRPRIRRTRLRREGPGRAPGHPPGRNRPDRRRAAVRANPSISPRIKISGYSYDVETGLLTPVVPGRLR